MQIPDLQGKALGQYTLRDFVGKGGMGMVYRAYQERLKRDVAVKILAAIRSSQPEHIQRFNREAETSALLEHPHIVPIYDYGTQDDITYVVMRFLSGGSLSERINLAKSGRQPRMSLFQIADLLRQVGGALDYAHAKGVIHRDIKPSNVMFDNVGNAFLVDFGLVKLLDSSGGTLTSSGMILGTPTYMAPEQWLDESLSPAIDQYALGIIIYTLLTEELPFDATKPYELMNLHCNHMPPPPHQKRPDVPEAVSEVIFRAIAKKTTDRFPNVTEFAQAFQNAISNQPTSFTPKSALGLEETPVAQAYIPPIPASVPEAKPLAFLYVSQSRDKSMIGQRVAITELPFEIGRLSRHLNFDNDKNVSRSHARIFIDDAGDFYLEDLGSTLATTIQQAQLQPYAPVRLEQNDQICLGTTTFLTFTFAE